MLPEKPYALSCDRNSEPILAVLKEYLKTQSSLLEVGAGTGQHAIFMAPYFQKMTWTIADMEDRHQGIKMWIKDFPRSNIKGPLEYEIGKTDFPEGEFDAVFSANTLHIISWEECLQLFAHLKNLKTDSLFMVYGPFNYKGEFTSESNKKFQEWLADKFPRGGIKDFEKVQEQLALCGFNLLQDHEMPANNRLLVFQKCLRH